MSEKPRILVVEDNVLNMKLCCAILKGRYEVIPAETAEEGLEAARHTMPDLILMDIQLPGMDGLAATRVLKSDEALRVIPVIALTSFAMVGDREKALAAGCDDYLPKPIDIQALKAMIADFLQYQPAAQNGPPGGRNAEETEVEPQIG